MKTESGFNFKVDKDVIDDVRVVEIIRKVESNPTMIIDLADKVLGEKQKEALYSHLEKIHGKARLTDVNAELTEIFHLLGDKEKKS